MTDYDVIELNEIDSTQTYLVEKDDNLSLPEYTVVYTTQQTSGRGQGSNKWESQTDKNISFSFVLRPGFISPANQYVITKIVSLAIVDVLQEYGIENVRIKWPNDIYVKEKKICGILVQNKVIGNELSAVYVGIGININQKDFVFAPNPTSFLLEKGREFEKKEVFNSCMQRIIHMYNMYKQGNYTEIDRGYLSKLLFLNQYRKYICQEKEIEAKITGVNEYGHLILEDRRGENHVAELREIKFVF